MISKHVDPVYRERHRSGIKESWTAEKRKKQSCISRELWADPKFAAKITQASKDAWSDPDKRSAASRMVQGLWQDPEYRAVFEIIWDSPVEHKARSERAMKMWQDLEYRQRQETVKITPEHRALQAELAIKRWQDPNYRNIIIESQKELWLDPAIREAMSERVKELWQDPKYQKKQFHVAVDPGLCRQKSENARHQWQDPNVRTLLIQKIKEAWANPSLREQASLTSKQHWQDPEFQKKQAKARAAILLNGKDSILERTAQIVLDALHVPYERHFVIGYFEFDLFIPSHKLLIECQGEYWHSLRKDRDAAKFTYIDTYFPEYRIMYLWERDFIDPRLIKQKFIRELMGEDSPLHQVNFSFDDIRIKQLDVHQCQPNSFYSAPEEFLQSFHYAGYGRSAKVVYGAFLDDILIGVCKFASPIRNEAATSMGFSQAHVLELDRFCLHPCYQKKNFASWLISRCTRMAFTNYSGVESIYGYADATFGHSGTIYRAANWRTVHTVRPDYYYVNQDGFVIHKKTLYDHAKRNGRSETEYAAEHGYLKVRGREKTKFAFARPKCIV
jgi:GNAT superfamily N-acetyltransferase/very-short-patch-repair endonuclease